jgi:hypothetical protein
VLSTQNRERIPREVLTDLESSRLRPYLKDCLSFEQYYLHEADQFGIDQNLEIDGDFFARSITMNFRKILFDIVAMNPD